jgi:hypothetical protein
MNPVNAKFVNIDIPIDWAALLESVKPQQGVEITTDPAIWRMEVPDYTEILNLWNKANYFQDAVKWINYYPGQHYSQEDIDETLCKHLNVKYRRSWLSRIDPGYSAPWHWDVEDDKEEEENALRFSVFLGDGKLGHIFILGKETSEWKPGDEDYFINMKHGSIIEWNSYRNWHIGANIGLVPKYMYHLKATRL